jgi:hypothetical protein
VPDGAVATSRADRIHGRHEEPPEATKFVVERAMQREVVVVFTAIVECAILALEQSDLHCTTVSLKLSSMVVTSRYC